MTSDPKPDNPVAFHHTKGTVPETDSRRVDAAFAFQLLKMQAWMTGIVPEQPVRLSGIFLSCRWQFRESAPKPSSRFRLDQRSSSKGRVSPRASSSSASWANSRRRSRLAANRRFHLSSSARESRISDAIASCSSRGSAPIFSSAFSSSGVICTGYQTEAVSAVSTSMVSR